MNINDFQKKKIKGEKITFVTCYDYTSARIVDASDVDCILVGDTLAMTMHGYDTTIPATVEMIVLHTRAVVKGAPKTFIVADMPFLSYRKSLADSMDAVQALMQAGAQAVKLEGLDGNMSLIKHIVESGVPVMGHIGLMPQFFHALGGFRVQGRDDDVAKDLVEQAKLLQEAGCFSIVLECMPAELAHRITKTIQLPTIGIGAGPHTSGQILVWQDMLGMQNELDIKFVKRYFNGFEMIKHSLNAYHHEVQESVYPDLQAHCYE